MATSSMGSLLLSAKQTSPLAKAKQLASSKDRDDRVKALRWLNALAKPGTTSGDEATYRYAELCLRFHREGEKSALEQAKKAFANLQKKAGSRWGLRGKIGLLRVQAIEGKRPEAIKGLDGFLARQTKCERAVAKGKFDQAVQNSPDDKTLVRAVFSHEGGHDIGMAHLPGGEKYKKYIMYTGGIDFVNGFKAYCQGIDRNRTVFIPGARPNRAWVSGAVPSVRVKDTLKTRLLRK